jgi:hemerythrin
MALIAWDPIFSVNIELVDKQHQMLVQIINDLYDAMIAGKDKDLLGKLINRLHTYAAMHFAREEHFFETFGYPETSIHVREHKDFEKKVSDFEAQFKAGRQSLSKDIVTFLSDWLVKHIKGSDKRYGPYLNERGVK